MTTSFRPAVREKVPLLIGLAGGTSSGKTYSALRLAKGLAGDKKFVVIDTENGRAKHYADDFAFDHSDLLPPYASETYTARIQEADKAGYGVIVVDSMSHVWAGEGGVLEQHDTELERRAGDDWRKREACNMAAWIQPKMKHKAMMARLLRVRAHVIMCFRAEQKIEIARTDKGKMQVQPMRSPIGLDGLDGWMPVCEKDLPFELTLMLLFKRDKPGVPKIIKAMGRHRAFFGDRVVDEEAGRLMGEWSDGASVEGKGKAQQPKAAEPASFKDTCITADQARQITEYAESLDVDSEKFNAWMMQEWSSQKVSELPVHAFDAVMEMLEKKEYERQGRD